MTEEEQEILNDNFCSACSNGNLADVKKYLKEGANIHHQDDSGFARAAQDGYFDIIKYLVTGDDLKEKASPRTRNDQAYTAACKFGNLEMVKYFLTSPELKEHCDPNACYGEGFEKALFEGHMEIIKYLATSHNILETEPVKMIFSREPQLEKKIRDML